MKLRMYLRGLGLGLIVAALVMSFGVKAENKTMTDAQIRQRALELGMVDDSTTLKATETVSEEITPEEEEVKPEETVVEAEKEEVNSGEEVKPEETVVESGKEELKPEAEKEEAKPELKKEEVKTEPKKEEVPANIMTNTKNYTLTIMGGYSSDRVAKILEGAGVVDSAAAFDKYLCNNGYDHRISTGTYNIPAGSDYAAIAKIITHSN